MKLLESNSLEKTQKDIINRLKTIRGHIAGIEKMVAEEKECDAILAQILATKSSIHKIGLLIMEVHAHDCLSKPDENDRLDVEHVKEVLRMVLDFAK